LRTKIADAPLIDHLSLFFYIIHLFFGATADGQKGSALIDSLALSFVYTQIQIIVLCLVPLIAPIPVASADGWEARG
jgi:hypothetical protein